MDLCKAGRLEWGAKLWLNFVKGNMRARTFQMLPRGEPGGWPGHGEGLGLGCHCMQPSAPVVHSCIMHI